MCCELCGCLGFCPEKASRDTGTAHSNYEVCSRTELETSSIKGCDHCGLAFRASLLLRSADFTPSFELAIGIHSNCPTTIQAWPPATYQDIFEVYALAGADTKRLLGKDVPMRSDSGETMAFVQDCYRQCLESHVKCDTKSATLPKRVLDISSPSLRLVESDGQIQGAYAALSYTWGHLKYEIATCATLEELKTGVSWSALPVVFQEAITIGQMLGIQYIWIDTMCILQDDPRDWEVEASKMAQIFSNACIVIVASASPDPGHSFLTEYEQKFRSTAFRVGSGPSETYRARRQIPLGIHMPFPSPKYSDPIDLRAWTMQELELSTRAILFTSAEVQWICTERRSCQCGTPSQARRSSEKPCPDVQLGHPNADAHHEWHKTVERYSARRLTYAKDKLPALMGLAQRFHHLHGPKYIAGLWKENLLNDLAWIRESESGFQLVTQYLAPTFSWVSVFTAVHYQFVRYSWPGTRRRMSKILDYQCDYAGTNTFDRIKHGMLTICGPTIKATLRCTTPQDSEAYELLIKGVAHKPESWDQMPCLFSIDSPLQMHQGNHLGSDEGQKSLERCTKELGEPFEEVPVKLLSLFSIHNEIYYENFLILGRSRKHSDTYERLGMGTGRLDSISSGENVGEIPGEMIEPFEWVKSLGSDSDLHSLGSLLEDRLQIV